MHTQQSYVALVPTGDRQTPVLGSTSADKSNKSNNFWTQRHIALLGFACLVALSTGCATMPHGRPTAAPQAPLETTGDWLPTEPGLAGGVTTPEADDEAEWFDAETAATPPPREPAAGVARRSTGDRALRGEAWGAGPEERDALYYLRGRSRPMPDQSWHSSDGTTVLEAYPATTGYGTPGS